jgi:hypothetical protein
VDNLCDFDSAVVVRYGYRVHNGRSDSYPARNSCNSSAGTHHSRAAGPLTSEGIKKSTDVDRLRSLTRLFT